MRMSAQIHVISGTCRVYFLKCLLDSDVADPVPWADRSKSDSFKQRESPIWGRRKQLKVGEGWSSWWCQLSSATHIQEGGWGGIIKRDSFIYLRSVSSRSLSRWSAWYFQQYCNPVKVKATPGKPFDYNGEVSHDPRAVKAPMTHPAVPPVSSSGIDFTL